MKPDEFPSKDLYFASYLLASGQKLLRVDRDGRQCWFVFGDKRACLDLQLKFTTKNAQIDAKEYANALRTLKDLIFTEG